MSDHVVVMLDSGEVGRADDEVWVSGELWRLIVSGEVHSAVRYDPVPLDLGTVAFGVAGLGLGVVRYRVVSVPAPTDVRGGEMRERFVPGTYAILRRIHE